MAEGLVLEGGSRPRRRRTDRDSWTAKKERAFLEALTGSCNVKFAARKAGVSASAIYARRSKHASFRAAWDRAIAEGYSRMELMLLERALHGVEKAVTARDGTTSVMREYSDRVALALLRMHRETAAIANDTVDEGDFDEARERIAARLQRIRERDESTVETKGLPDRIALVRWALRRGSGQALMRRQR